MKYYSITSHILSLVSHLVHISFSCLKGRHAATSHHPHPQTCQTCRRAKEQEKPKNKDGGREGGCGQPKCSGECLHGAERMGAAKKASSADFGDCSHGCSSHSVITVQAPDTPLPPPSTSTSEQLISLQKVQANFVM